MACVGPMEATRGVRLVMVADGPETDVDKAKTGLGQSRD